MKNIALTGTTGFIGKNLVKQMSQNPDIKIHAIVRKNSDLSFLKDHNIDLIFYDGTFNSLNEFFSKEKIDVVIHLATLYLFEHKPQEIDGLIDSNIKFGCHLLEAAAMNNCRKFINAGSYIQNYFSEEYYSSCLYAATKESLQNIIDYYALNRGLSAITLKLYDVYGANDDRKKILNSFKKLSENGERLKMSPGEQELRLTYVDDVLEAIEISIKMLENFTAEHKIYYVGAEAYKLKEVAKIFEEISKKTLNIEWGAFPYREGQPMKSYIGELLPNWKFTQSKISGCFIIEPEIKKDNRGLFVKIFNESLFKKNGINVSFKESFYSISHKNCLRGMHYQKSPHQIAKLIHATDGEVLDVFLDIRKNSPTYGQFDYCVISQENAKMIFLPEGIAHGFLTLSEKATVCYLQSREYDQESDAGILWNSFGMDWKISDPIISDRDKNFINFSQL
jgi:dTDP-4-dehydrorhamnose 3,5-epimerase